MCKLPPVPAQSASPPAARLPPASSAPAPLFSGVVLPCCGPTELIRSCSWVRCCSSELLSVECSAVVVRLRRGPDEVPRVFWRPLGSWWYNLSQSCFVGSAAARRVLITTVSGVVNSTFWACVPSNKSRLLNDLSGYMDAQRVQIQTVPKLEDFLGGETMSSLNTQDSSTLTHIYDPEAAVPTYFNNAAQEIAPPLSGSGGFQAFPTSSGSEIDDSASVGRAEFIGRPIESRNELGFSSQFSLTVVQGGARAIVSPDGDSDDTGGLGDMKLICGITAAEEKEKLAKGVKCIQVDTRKRKRRQGLMI